MAEEENLCTPIKTTRKGGRKPRGRKSRDTNHYQCRCGLQGYLYSFNLEKSFHLNNSTHKEFYKQEKEEDFDYNTRYHCICGQNGMKDKHFVEEKNHIASPEHIQNPPNIKVRHRVIGRAWCSYLIKNWSVFAEDVYQDAEENAFQPTFERLPNHQTELLYERYKYLQKALMNCKCGKTVIVNVDHSQYVSNSGRHNQTLQHLKWLEKKAITLGGADAKKEIDEAKSIDQLGGKQYNKETAQSQEDEEDDEENEENEENEEEEDDDRQEEETVKGNGNVESIDVVALESSFKRIYLGKMDTCSPLKCDVFDKYL